MFVSSGQFYVFCAAAAFGGAAGFLLSVSGAIKTVSKNKVVGFIADTSAFALAAFAFVPYSYALNFPSFRPYMAAGVFLGLFLYAKSYHILLAKPVKILYNVCRNKFEKNRERKNARIEIQKTRRRAHGGGGNTDNLSAFDDDLSARRNRRSKQKKRGAESGNRGIQSAHIGRQR